MPIKCQKFRFAISKIKFYMNIFQKSENVVILPQSLTRSNECVSLLQKHSSNVQLTLRGHMTYNLYLQRLPSMHELLQRVYDFRSPPIPQLKILKPKILKNDQKYIVFGIKLKLCLPRMLREYQRYGKEGGRVG